MLQAQPRAKLRKRKAKFKPALLHQLVMRRKAIQIERRKFKPHSAAARTARNNKLTMPKRSVNSRAMCDIKLRDGAKFKEPLNFKVRRILRILKFTALKFHALR